MAYRSRKEWPYFVMEVLVGKYGGEVKGLLFMYTGGRRVGGVY